MKLELYNICSLSKKKEKVVKIKCTDLVLRNVLNSSGRNEMFYAFFATILTIVVVCVCWGHRGGSLKNF